MGDSDRTAVAKLQGLGHAWHQGSWQQVHGDLVAEADAMHAMLVRRADQLEAAARNSSAEAEAARQDRRPQA
jgi:hypothetical protein